MLQSFQLGPLALPTYPLLLILGFYLGLFWAARTAQRRGLDPDHVYNAGFYAAVAGIIGGRLGHVAFHLPAYAGDPLSILSPNLAAFQPWVALAAALLLVAWYIRKHRLPLLPLFDALASGGLLTLVVLALADFLNGRHYGSPTVLPWAVFQWDVARHPVQLYELAGTLMVILLLWWRLDRLTPGRGGMAAIAGYAAVRLVVDAFRAQPVTIGDGFRLSQVIALVVLVLVLLAFYQTSPRNPAHRPQA
ncbi:MAG: hypothetical protein D6775_10920 [Caldilineae bacterium]|nr:MAG: hypothetical protein D6775_10920 [Caldilineae bacterium]